MRFISIKILGLFYLFWMSFNILCLKEEIYQNNSVLQQELKNLSKYKPKESIPDLECLIEALWFESRGESSLGIKAVASVVYNRKQSGLWGNTFCQVVQSPMQFSYRNSVALGNFVEISLESQKTHKYKEIREIAQKTYEGEAILNNSVKWYTTISIKPPEWTKGLKKEVVIDRHVFYKNK